MFTLNINKMYNCVQKLRLKLPFKNNNIFNSLVYIKKKKNNNKFESRKISSKWY